MDRQQLVSLLIVAAAAFLLGWNRLRRRRFSFDRDLPCGCSGVGRSQTSSSIIFRARKGERSVVIVKMK